MDIVLKKCVSIMAVSAACLLPVVALAAMSSTNYYIYADTVGVNGGDSASSGNFSLQDTLGESPIGVASSTGYEVRGGYQAMERGSLSISLSKQSVDLGTLDVNTVSTDSTTVRVSSDAATGYTLAVSAVNGTMPAAVADGTVSAGAEEYGLSTSMPSGKVNGDVAVVPGLVLASTSTPAVDDPIVVTFKASRAANSAANTYSQSITLTASANF